MFRAVNLLIFEATPLSSVCFTRLSSTASREKSASDESRFAHHDKKTIYGEEFPIWHKPLSERPEEFSSKFSLLGFDRINFTKMEALDETLSWKDRFVNWFSKHIEEMEIEDQVFSNSRYKMLGPDLATAHFICYRGGAVRLHNSDKWIKKIEGRYGFEVELPSRFVPGMYVEAIDCENFVRGGIRYEGFQNLINLDQLKWISFKNSVRFDDWSMDRISNIVNETVEYLDIRGTKVTYRGLNVLCRFKKIKFLLTDIKYDQSEADIIENTFAMLQEYHKDLLIKNGD